MGYTTQGIRNIALVGQASSGKTLLTEALPVTDLPGFAKGWFVVQDAGAQLAAPLLGVENGMRVLDACAAPGGKTTHLAELANLDLVAVDSNAARLERVAENLARLLSPLL